MKYAMLNSFEISSDEEDTKKSAKIKKSFTNQCLSDVFLENNIKSKQIFVIVFNKINYHFFMICKR